MTTPPIRELLPCRRGGYNQKLKIGGHTVHLRTGEYENGRLGEIFLDVSKTGTTVRALLTALAMAVSRALQYGVPLQEFVDAFKGFGFTPDGTVEGDPRILKATSILDCIFTELEETYIKKNFPPESATVQTHEDGQVLIVPGKVAVMSKEGNTPFHKR